MIPLTLILRIVGLLLVASSFFMGRILMVFPGLPLTIGGIPFKHLIFALGVLIYVAAAWKSKMDWQKSRRAKE